MMATIARSQFFLAARRGGLRWMSTQRAGAARKAVDRLQSLFERSDEKESGLYAQYSESTSLILAILAREAGETEEVVIGALLHDIGHLLGLEAGYEPAMDGCGTVDHEGIGHDFILDLGLPPTIAFLTKHHVSAKRYLCLREPGYYEKLSEASKTTLKHQGGIMSEEEAQSLEKDERWDAVLRFRTYDEAAKDPNSKDISVSSFFPTIQDLIVKESQDYSPSPFASSYMLSKEQLRRWDEDGMLIVPNALKQHEIGELSTMADEVGSLPPDQGPWLVHHELVDEKETSTKRLCRVENFCKHHSKWGELCFGIVQDCVSQVERETVVLFKDKLNYKGPGGGGFLLHQDATAYATENLAKRHVSVMVAIDEATPENGCLQVAPGRHREGIFPHESGVMKKEIEEKIKFSDVLVQPGDIVLFDSYLPHRSEGNKTDGWRRLAYLTFNKLSEGDLHEHYYQEKAKVMQRGAISINLDFGGKIVD